MGDGQNPTGESGFDTDVLHVNGVLHLTPRTSPPEFDSSVAPSDRVGLLYFDLTRNCPRLSIALLKEGQTAEDWHDAEIAWVDMILETDKIDPARDVVGGGGAEGSLAASGDKEAVCAAIERAGAEAAAGRSPYARPRVELDGSPDVALVNEAGGPQVNGPATVRLRVSGFSEGMTPRVFWRREGFATDGGRGSTHWMELPGAALATDGAGATAPDGTPLPGVSAMTASLDLSSPGPDGMIAQAGHTVQF